MGTREDLLAAAKKCIAERGYARTTVRDIVAASGTNLAAINYHFRTREALLSQAITEAMAEAMETILGGMPESGAPLAGRLEGFWSELTASFGRDRDLWAANIEALTAAMHSPELRARMSADQQRARDGFGEALGDSDAGAAMMTLLTGLLVQWMVDPERAPTAGQLTAGVEFLGAAPA